jgi:hypothetical protein
MLKRLTPLVALAGFVAMASCNNESGSGISAACDRYARTYCEAAVDCDPLATAYIDPATCADRFGTFCENAFVLEGTGVTPEELDTCSATVEEALCEGSYTALFDVCYPLVAGTLPEGAPCAATTQCSSGWCDISDASRCGVCATLPAVGEPCPEGRCAFSAICSEGTCTELTFVDDGEPCDPPTANCNFRAWCSDGVCVALASEGEACESGRCRSGLDCDATSGVCVRGPAPATVGQACGFDADTGDFVVCNATAYCADDVCVAKVADGGSCVGASECLLGAQCIEGICQIGFPMCE